MPKYAFNIYKTGGVVTPSTLKIVTNGLPTAPINQAYSLQFEASGGVQPYVWSLVAPNNVLPSGMSFTAAGNLIGTPTVAGTTGLNFRVTDNAGTAVTTGVLNFQVAAAGAFIVTTSSLPAITRGASYSTNITSSGGSGTVTYALVAPNNVLPTGITMSTAGLIQGIPTVAGSTVIKVRATDGTLATADSGLLTIVVNQVTAPVITNSTPLPPGTNGVAYSRTFTANGGWKPYTWSKLSGTFPGTMTLNSSTGVLSGTSTVETTSSFTIRVTDSEGRTGDKAFDLTINAPGAVEGFNDFYVAQAAHATTVYANNLRSQVDINAATSTTEGVAKNTWKYAFGSDVYHTPKDAARVAMAHSLSDDQLRIPLGGVSSGKILIMSDFLWGREFRDNLNTAGQGLNHKFTQIFDAGPKNSGESIYIETRAINYSQKLPAPQMAERDLRTYLQGEQPNEGPLAEWGMVFGTPYTPAGAGGFEPVATYKQRYGIWTRDWQEIQLDLPGTAFTSFKNCTSTGAANANAVGTRNIVNTASDGLGNTIITTEPWEWVNKAGEVFNAWPDKTNDTPATVKVTITGHSNAVMNTTHECQCIDSSHLKVLGTDVGSTVGTGGTCSKHYHMYSWWHAEEDTDPFSMYYQIPVQRRGGLGRLQKFAFEINTSKQIDEVLGWFLTTAPSVANPTVITTPTPHGLSTNDLVHMSGSYPDDARPVPTGAYPITVTGANTFTIPHNVTTVPAIRPAGVLDIQDVNLGDIGVGDSFLLAFKGSTAATPISFASDMSSAITAALRSIGMNSATSTVKLSDHIYRVSMETVRTSLINITPTGFTSGGVTKVQQGTADNYYSNTYGRITKCCVGYARNLIVQRNRDGVDLTDTALFKKPVDG